MRLKNFRVVSFYWILAPFSKRTRKSRMRLFMRNMNVSEKTSILDLGGQPMIWDSVPASLDLTILNRPGVAVIAHQSHHNIFYVEGDACEVGGVADRLFDIVFSNSVIEHVGEVSKQAAFAREVRRLGKAYWVQTPSKWFPIEAHCGMPFWWLYPSALQRHFIKRWKKKLPAWTMMVEETTVLSKADLKTLFPEAKVITETILGVPKSYVACFVGKDEGNGLIK